jgi:hypothetical protein
MSDAEAREAVQTAFRALHKPVTAAAALAAAQAILQGKQRADFEKWWVTHSASVVRRLNG